MLSPIEFRRHLHRHPELSFAEHQTAAFIAETLQAAGISCRPIAQTGIIATIRGLHTAADDRRAVVLRADIDALPIDEQTSLDYASVQAGVMHACGHDMHAAMLYGALLELASTRDFAGTVVGLFQPGEECNPGGASLVLDEDPFADYEVVAVIGQHVDWQLEVAQIGLREGPLMAASDELRLWIKGKGGHGAMRQLLNDPIAAAAQTITGLLTLNEQYPDATLSIGRVEAAGATNVVPDEVYIEGTLRTFNEAERHTLHEKIGHVAAANDRHHGTSTRIEINHGYPAVMNDPALCKTALATAAELGIEGCIIARRMTAEDFGFYTLRYPSLFWRLGVGQASGRSHTSHYAPSEEAIPHGIKLMTSLALKLLTE